MAATLGTEILNSSQWRDKCRYWQLWDQISRVTDAWRTIRRVCQENENHIAGAATQANKPIDVHILRAAKLQFWKRYKTTHPMEVSPSEHLLSLCHKQMEERLLTVQDMEKVRTMAHQVAAKIKEQQRYSGQSERAEETSEVGGAGKYMARLYTYLLALGIAGSDKVQNAPEEEEYFGSDSTKFVKAPWDILQAYYFRALRLSKLVPEASRLAWLQEKDTAERAAWVSRFHNGNESLGEVVKAVMDSREAHWLNPPQRDVTPERPASPSPAKSSKEPPNDHGYMTLAQQRQAAEVKADSRSERDEWPKYQRIRMAEYGWPKYGCQEPNGIYTKHHAPSEAPTGCSGATNAQRHSLLLPSASMGDAAAHREGPPDITVATPEPPSHSKAWKQLGAWQQKQLDAAGAKHASSWKQETKNAKDQAWNLQHLPPLTSGSSLGATAIILQDKDPSPWLGLCQDFNVEECKGVISASARGYGPLWCYKGWHKCAKILSNGLQCGMPCHGASRHHEAERPFAYIKPGGQLTIVCNTLHTRMRDTATVCEDTREKRFTKQGQAKPSQPIAGHTDSIP